MKKGKKIVVQCHCILNCNSKVDCDVKYKGAMEFNKKLIDDGFGIIQLPCPELIMYGTKRWGHTKEQFNNMMFRSKCRELLKDYVYQIKMYIDDNYEIKGILAIDGSPSCGYNKTCSSDNWYGELVECKNLEEKLNTVKLVDEMGVFIEVLVELLKEYKINVPIYGIEESRLKESLQEIYKKLCM